MNRTEYYNYIDEKLHTLALRIDTNGKLNMLHLHMHSESFYLHLLNLLYGYKLENLNKSLQNVAAIDLIDHKNKIIIQVSATSTKAKVESALEKKIIKQFPSYKFMFLSISKNASKLRNNNFRNPHGISFSPASDILDVKSILNEVLQKDMTAQKGVYALIRDELGNEVDVVKLNSNLAMIINILAKEKWSDDCQSDPVHKFEINRKISHNQLNKAKDLIEEYSLYHGKVDSKYSEFDSMASNKSSSVLATIKREYIKVKDTGSSDDVFFSVIDVLKTKVVESANYSQIPIDELELCLDILVVDAFIRCKIMENPEGYKYAAS
ncbi:MAG: SMEK domain-containing protein [Methylicorpusculum sp.]|uniref:ABC-three component system protein n=1 Tax=Methylicorpusculum sp. TaxID=2713644 RepID=UPI0027319BA5|nr:ABC-three component system protein [Methylicorpusculum sp.]MDP2202248.1 SMEK domain-containing protein [Methylicorpusculum sp.]